MSGPGDEDMIFVVGPQTFLAHSRILVPRSTYFAALVSSANNTRIQQVLPPSITPSAFESLLTYLYSSKYTPPLPPPSAQTSATPPPAPTPEPEEKALLYAVSVPRVARTLPSLLVELYCLANEYQLEDLKGLVAKDIVGRLGPETVWGLRDKAVECGVGLVVAMADAYARKHGIEGGGGGGEGGAAVPGPRVTAMPRGGARSRAGVAVAAGGNAAASASRAVEGGSTVGVRVDTRPVKRVARRFSPDGSEL
ncbi:hypothetical protein BDK51DRAFT_51728 [Blyttiomyces helicus]|uniref:BTB domain-containing protein n=1 Tax=Blyttiomyces helicus TaxID=388810 RepID=A0A4P9W7F2_9FUNG|nr:hypothetical protein BDK51DRAFT_51728 [Blyttiomyces helicus]|eukprot:RKO88389.1 hypothetical protein BDK51DRAFT_51728 [Blyttiomyces helicus]